MGKRKSILVIENDKYMNDILCEFLESEGYKSDSAENYNEAVKKLKKRKYTMLIMDYNLNGIKEKNGIDVYEYAKGLYPELKGILITAFGSKSVKESAKEKGISQILDKPFSFGELMSFLK